MHSHVLFLAIPSPDLVINLFASASQVLGLVAVGASGLMFRRRSQPGVGSNSGANRGTVVGLGVLWALTAGTFLLYHLKVADAHEARLRQALVRPALEAGQGVADSSLFTLDLSTQGEHPAGLSSAGLSALLALPEGLQVIDVREPEEIEKGSLAGAQHIPYPDLLAGEHDQAIAAGAVLVCFSGNRSSELTEALRSTHPGLRFVVGGFEKWVAENRQITGGGDRSSLRELPSFPGGDQLLDTPEVQEQVTAGGVLFVDVRHPDQFNAGHLPGAVNAYLRGMTRAEGRLALASFGDSRVIVPCYDKRSSFYGSVLGLRVTRGGGEFIGRYTVPHEYLPAGAGERAYRAEWALQRAGRTPYGWLVSTFAGWLEAMGGWLGLGWAIALLALVARAATLPLSWKGGCDHWVEWKNKQAWSVVGASLKFDPVRRARALRELRRTAGLTPVRNLIGSMIQLVLFLALLTAVGQVSRGMGAKQTFLWLPALNVPDTSRVLALCCGGLAAGLLMEGRWSRRSTGRGRSLLCLAAAAVGGLLIVLTWNLTAGQNVYLVLSLAWVALQGRAAHRSVLGRRDQVRPFTRTLVKCGGQEDVGRKAERLGVMAAMGMPVPWGFALTTWGVEALANPDSRMLLERDVRRAFRRLGVQYVAVRSSGLGEDGAHASFAGIYDTQLHVNSEELMEAIESVAASLRSGLALASGSTDTRGGVLVQAMVPAQYSGVLFTEHPTDAGASLVEWTRGVGEELVGGQVMPEAATFGRLTGALREGAQPEDSNFDDLVDMGRRIEERFGTPQDVEWAMVRGALSILQARDITVRAGSEGSGAGHFERDRERLVTAVIGEPVDAVLLVQDEVSELLPSPTPFSARFMADMWLPGGTVDLACRSLGVRFSPEENGHERVQFAFGQVWTHKGVQRAQDGGISSWAGFQLSRCLPVLELEVASLAQRAKRTATLDRALDLSRLEARDLVTLFEDRLERFTTRSYVTAERVNVAAEWFMSGARKRLEDAGLNPASHLAPRGGAASRAMEELNGSGTDGTSTFLQRMHHRALHDFEWAEERYGDDSRLVGSLAGRAGVQAEGGAQRAGEVLKGILAATVERARRLQVLKEDAKHYALVDLALARRAVSELSSRLGLEGDAVWSLEPGDVSRLVRSSDGAAVLPGDLRIKMAKAERLREVLEGMDLPTRLTPRDIEGLGREGLQFELPAAEALGLRGSRVAGAEDVVGFVRVCTCVEDLDDFKAGEILVTRFTDPSWSAVFGTAGGLVTEVGGWLSHAAILAREKNLPAIVGVPCVLRALETGMRVRLGTDGLVEILPSEGVAEEAMSLGRAASSG
ncbi:MAG: PEP-utilizing enzyme [Planctomycetota bacterium]|nr:PEP-utilizing enzyme [Planctomycetota bacterium]